MSESAGGPTGGTVAPSTPAPGGTEPGSITSPPPNTQPAISVSDAARMLARQRQQAGQGSPQLAANGAQNQPVAQNGEAARQNGEATATPSPSPGGLAAMEAALGVPEGLPGGQEAAPVYEIEGRRYSAAEMRELVAKSRDYTFKTQQLAEQARQMQAQHDALATVLPYIQPELARLAEVVQNAPQRPDPRLLDIDPNRYHRERAAWEQGVEEQNRLATLNQLQSQAQQRAMEQQVAAGNAVLAQEFPFWSDPQQRLEAQQQIVQWALNKGGFSHQELQGLTNPAQLKAMMKAAMFDRWVEQAKTSAPRNGISPVRGTAPPPAPGERVQAAQQAFDAKPDWRTGASLLAARRKNG